MSVRVRIVAAVWLLVGCGGGSEAPDASAPDAAIPDASPPDAIPCDQTLCGTECVDTTSNHDYCGDCDTACSPTQSCGESECSCPTITTPSGTFTPLMTQMDTTILAPTVLGIGVYTPDDEIVHAVVIGYHPEDTPLDTDLDLSASAAGQPPFVGFGYDLDVVAQTYRGSFRSVSGTLHLTARCADGVAGTMTDVVLEEVDATTEPPVTIEDGCSVEISSLTFDYFSSQCN